MVVNGGTIISTGRALPSATARRQISTILSSEQFSWLRDQLYLDSAQWYGIGQQVLMARYLLPASILEALDPGISPDNPNLAGGTAAVLAAVTAKGKAPEDRTPAESALLDSAILYNPDACDGYAFERDALLAFAQQMGPDSGSPGRRHHCMGIPAEHA